MISEVMNLKRKIKIIIIAVLAVALMGIAIALQFGSGTKIKEGKYNIVDCDEYPDAYVEVDAEGVQFHNIDLNDIYQKSQMELYNRMKEKGAVDYEEDYVNEISDLNKHFVDSKWEIDYEKTIIDKTGTFSHVYFCYIDNSAFGFVFEYDSFHHTFQINSPARNLKFKK